MVACASASRRRGLGLGTQLMLTSSCAVSFIKLILRWRGVDFVFKPFDTCCLCTFFERLRVSPGGRTLRVDERQDKRLSPGFGARHVILLLFRSARGRGRRRRRNEKNCRGNPPSLIGLLCSTRPVGDIQARPHIRRIRTSIRRTIPTDLSCVKVCPRPVFYLNFFLFIPTIESRGWSRMLSGVDRTGGSPLHFLRRPPPLPPSIPPSDVGEGNALPPSRVRGSRSYGRRVDGRGQPSHRRQPPVFFFPFHRWNCEHSSIPCFRH